MNEDAGYPIRLAYGFMLGYFDIMLDSSDLSDHIFQGHFHCHSGNGYFDANNV